MSKLIIKFIILFTPLLFLIGVCAMVGYSVGELYPLNYIAELQAENRQIKYMITGSRGKRFAYKLTSIQVQEPELVLLGSSRGWYFRDLISNKCPNYFYNASVMNASINEISTVFDEIIQMEYKPKVILLSLDYPDFNVNTAAKSKSTHIDKISDFDYTMDAIKRSIVHVFADPSTITEVFNTSSNTEIGWGFVNDQSDYYNGDGSYFSRHFTDDFLTSQLVIHSEYIANGEEQYRYGSEVDNTAFELLENILQLADENDIEVIGFLPPYHTEMLNQMQASGEFEYMLLAKSKMLQLFKQLNFPFYDFSDVESFGGSDKGMYDGWHPGELMSAQIYLQLLQNEPEILSRYSDIEYLDNLIENATNPYNLNVDRLELIEQSVCE